MEAILKPIRSSTLMLCQEYEESSLNWPIYSSVLDSLSILDDSIILFRNEDCNLPCPGYIEYISDLQLLRRTHVKGELVTSTCA